MTTTAKTIRSRTPAARRRRGFAFTEVLFAVMVLGLGFIMIAAMFPVTIRQTQSTLEETIGANVARGAVEYMQGVASDDLFPITTPPKAGVTPLTPDYTKPAEFVSLRDVTYYVQPVAGQTPASWGTYNANPALNTYFPAFNTVRGNMIDPSNPAIAWVPFYRREQGMPFAQVIVIAVRNRERDRYVGSMNPLYVGTTSGKMYTDLERPPLSPAMAATLEPLKVPVGFKYIGSQGHGTVQIDPTGIGRAATGAYLVVAQDSTQHPISNRFGQLIGHVFQLGNPIDETAGLWELSPAGDMVRADTTKDAETSANDDANVALGAGVQAYIIGRGYVDPSDGSKGNAGPAQDIAVYTGFIAIPPKTIP